MPILFHEGDPEIAHLVGNIARRRRSFANWVGMLIAGMLLVGWIGFAVIMTAISVMTSGWSKGLADSIEMAGVWVPLSSPGFLLAALPRIWAELTVLALRMRMNRATCFQSPAVVADVTERVVNWNTPGSPMRKATITLRLVTGEKEETFVMSTLEFYMIGGTLVFPQKVAAKGLLVQATYLVAPDSQTWLIRLKPIASV